MHKSIGYHTRAYNDNTVKLSGGSFGGGIDLETVERISRLFTVTVRPSGTPVFVDRNGKECRLYFSIDPRDTTKGKEALRLWAKERARQEEARQEQEAQEQEEIERAMSGLSHSEIMRRLQG